MPQLLDGKAASAHLLEVLKLKTEGWVANGGPRPFLTAILVGNDGGSETYVGAKMRACEQVGFGSQTLRFPDTITEKELLAEIQRINADPQVHGLIVQLPLPKHIHTDTVIETVSVHKDVDGFHPANFGKMAKGLPTYVSATPLGITRLMLHYGIETAGKHVVVIGRSQIVGLPMSLLMQRNDNPGNATVTLTHSRTQNLPALVRQADIVIAAIGKPGFVTADMVKPGAVVIDVGTTRVPDASKKAGWRLAGDVDFESVAPIASAITPVPGGVGPMTIAGLLYNTWLAATGLPF